ncbi:MAG: flagellar motor switch protein FliN [Stellaceae bacterium]
MMATREKAGAGVGEEAPTAGAAAEESPFASIVPPPDRAGDETEPAGATAAEPPGRLDLVLEVPVRLSVELGRTEIPIRDVVNLTRGAIVDLDRSPGEALDVLVNGVLIGRGEIVVVNEERLGLRFVEVVSQAERVKRLG